MSTSVDDGDALFGVVLTSRSVDGTLSLPAEQWPAVQRIVPGTPLFLYDTVERTISGVYEAISRGELVSSSAAVPAKSAWNNAPLEKIEKLPARVKARLVRGERKLSPAATAAWKNAEPTEGATLTGAAVASLVRALLGPDERADGPRDKGAFAAAHASDTSSIASDASSLARDTSTVSTVTVTAYDDGAWETVSGKKDRARLNDRAKKNARASGDARDEARARRARGGRRASDDGGARRRRRARV